MNGYEIVRAAIPGANEALCEHIIWGRTPFPVGEITPRSLYKAASRLKRAHDHGITLCDWCDNIAMEGDFICSSCDSAIHQ